MATTDGDRTKFFPAIERQHGQPVSFWLERLAELDDAKYDEKIAFLRENHGFSRTHANALVMYSKGSTSSKRFDGPDDYFASIDPTGARTAKKAFAAVMSVHPELELVIAWNHPMLRTPDGQYVIGMSAATRHLLVNPFSAEVLAAFDDDLQGYEVNKKTFKVPLDWDVDVELLRAMADARLAEL